MTLGLSFLELFHPSCFAFSFCYKHHRHNLCVNETLVKRRDIEKVLVLMKGKRFKYNLNEL